MRHPGRLFAFCGLDGAGKSTQIELLERAMSAVTRVQVVKQPGQWFRKDPLVRSFLDQANPFDQAMFAELAMFSALDRLRIAREQVAPLLQEGHTVICDRYTLCGYASLAAAGFEDINWYRNLDKYCSIPDLIIFLDIEPSLAFSRILTRDGAANKQLELDHGFLSRMRDGYVSELARINSDRLTLDANQSVQTLHHTICAKTREIVDGN